MRKAVELVWAILASCLLFVFAGASPAFGLEDCPGVTLGKSGPNGTTPWVYSNCKADTGGQAAQFYFVIRLNTDDTIQSILNTGMTLTPSPAGTVLDLGTVDNDLGFQTKDMGVGYTGDCTEIDDAKSATPAAVADHTYCGRTKVASGSIVAKATFNGTTFSDYSIKHGVADTDGDGVPDTRDAYPNDPTRSVMSVPATPAFGLLLLAGLLGLLGVRRLRL